MTVCVSLPHQTRGLQRARFGVNSSLGPRHFSAPEAREMDDEWMDANRCYSPPDQLLLIFQEPSQALLVFSKSFTLIYTLDSPGPWYFCCHSSGHQNGNDLCPGALSPASLGHDSPLGPQHHPQQSLIYSSIVTKYHTLCQALWCEPRK